MSTVEELLKKKLIDTPFFPVRAFRSDVLEQNDLKFRCYIIHLPLSTKLYELTMQGDNVFDEEIGGKITDLLSADIGKIKDETLIRFIDREEEDLDFIVIMFIQEYIRRCKHKFVPYEERCLDHCHELKRQHDSGSDVITRMFLENVDRFNVLIDIIGIVDEEDDLSFDMRYNNRPVDKAMLKRKIEMIMRPAIIIKP